MLNAPPRQPAQTAIRRVGTLPVTSFADGWHPLAISRRLGHSTITVTMDRYGHLLPSLEADLISRTAKTFTASLTATGTDNVTRLR